MQTVVIGAMVVLIMVLWLVYTGGTSQLVSVQSSLTGETFLVRDLPDQAQAADLLARVAIRLNTVVKQLQVRYPTDQRVKRLARRFDSSNIREANGDRRYTSYSFNKGQQISLCIRQGNNKDQHHPLIDLNTVIFVALHELSHIMTVSNGHTDEFWNNFKFLLEFADQSGSYVYHPYHQIPKQYCGTMITDTPYKKRGASPL